MYCPECGSDTGDAKFCPECGANLSGVKTALRGKTTGRQGGKAGRSGEKSGSAAPAASDGPSGRLSPAVIWGGFGALAVIVIIVVVMASGGFGGDSSGDGGGSAEDPAPATAVTADTSGSYRELVERGNGLYDQGDAAFQDQEFEQGSAFFSAAAKVYAAAWKKQPGDPALGTDYSVALFYSGDIPGALERIEAVIEANPDFQKAWLNKGIFLSHEARLAEQEGDDKQAQKLFDQARTAFTRAAAIDPVSEAGQQADASLEQLPE